MGTGHNPGGHQCWQFSCCLLVIHWQMEGDTLRLIGPCEKMAMQHKGNEGNKAKNERADWFLLLNLLLASIFSCTDDVIVIKVSSCTLAFELSLEALRLCLCSAAIMFWVFPLWKCKLNVGIFYLFNLPETMKYTVFEQTFTNEQIWFPLILFVTCYRTTTTTTCWWQYSNL